MKSIRSMRDLIMMLRKRHKDPKREQRKPEASTEEDTSRMLPKFNTKLNTEYYDQLTKSLFGCDENDEAQVINDRCTCHDTCPKRCTPFCKADNRKYSNHLRLGREKFMYDHFMDKYCKHGREFIREDGFCPQFLVDKCGHADKDDCVVREKFNLTVPSFIDVIKGDHKAQ